MSGDQPLATSSARQSSNTHPFDRIVEKHGAWSPMPVVDPFLSRVYRARQRETTGQDARRQEPRSQCCQRFLRILPGHAPRLRRFPEPFLGVSPTGVKRLKDLLCGRFALSSSLITSHVLTPVAVQVQPGGGPKLPRSTRAVTNTRRGTSARIDVEPVRDMNPRPSAYELRCKPPSLRGERADCTRRWHRYRRTYSAGAGIPLLALPIPCSLSGTRVSPDPALS
jgi:hypothetical protein